MTGLSTLEAPAMTIRPTEGLPVKMILLIEGHWTSAAPEGRKGGRKEVRRKEQKKSR
jgi:hypothetical protein